MFKYLNLAMIAAAWLARAAADGRITTRECVQLVAELVGASGLEINIDVADFNDGANVMTAPPAAVLPALDA